MKITPELQLQLVQTAAEDMGWEQLKDFLGEWAQATLAIWRHAARLRAQRILDRFFLEDKEITSVFWKLLEGNIVRYTDDLACPFVQLPTEPAKLRQFYANLVDLLKEDRFSMFEVRYGAWDTVDGYNWPTYYVRHYGQRDRIFQVGRLHGVIERDFEHWGYASTLPLPEPDQTS